MASRSPMRTPGSPIAQGPQPLHRQCRVDRVDPRRPHGVDAVGDRIEPGGHREFGWQPVEEVDVVDHRGRQHPRVDAGALAAGLGQAPDVGCLRAREGGRHGDDRQPGGERHRLGQSGGRAAADRDQEVGAALPRCARRRPPRRERARSLPGTGPPFRGRRRRRAVCAGRSPPRTARSLRTAPPLQRRVRQPGLRRTAPAVGWSRARSSVPPKETYTPGRVRCHRPRARP